MRADLVLEGGGVKGIGLVGAYAALTDAGYEVHRVAGTSAGAIVGALIAAGMPPAELERAMRQVDYGLSEDEGVLDHPGPVGRALSVLFEKGICEGNHLHAWLDDVLATLGARTFGDLRIDDPGSSPSPEKAYKLVVMVSDVTRGELVRLPWDYARYGLVPDDQLVADAVRASMSIPFFYEPFRFAGLGPDGNEAISFMVDGSLLSNFPIDVFDRTDGRPPRWPTLGVKLSARPAAPVTDRREVNGAFGLGRAVIGAMANAHDQMHIDEPSVIARTIFVDTGDVQATDFDIDEATQDMLYRSGRHAVGDFLPGWDFEGYVEEFRGDPLIDLTATSQTVDAA